MFTPLEYLIKVVSKQKTYKCLFDRSICWVYAYQKKNICWVYPLLLELIIFLMLNKIWLKCTFGF
jgi:hypothetical protein